MVRVQCDEKLLGSRPGPGRQREPDREGGGEPGTDTWPEAGVGTDEWNLTVRGEQPHRRADRNFAELLQELRVLQSGVQILFALLLTVAFTNTFSEITPFQRTVYVISLVCSALAAAVLTAPVAYHRRLFQQGRKTEVVRATHHLLQIGLFVLLLAVVGAVLLVVDQAAGQLAGLATSSLVGTTYALLWFGAPAWSQRSLRTTPSPPGTPSTAPLP